MDEGEVDLEDLGIDEEGTPLTEAQFKALLSLSPNSDAPLRWRKAGTSPPFIRLGRKHSRVLYPRAGVIAWLRQRV